MYCASASLAGNFPASQSSEYCRMSAAASHRRKSCNSPLASFLISSRVRCEGKLRDILAPPSSPRFMLDENKEQLIGWEANNEIPWKRMLLVKSSVSEQGNQRVRPLPSEPYGRLASDYGASYRHHTDVEIRTVPELSSWPSPGTVLELSRWGKYFESQKAACWIPDAFRVSIGTDPILKKSCPLLLCLANRLPPT
jgi:hypothetical protein